MLKGLKLGTDLSVTVVDLSNPIYESVRQELGGKADQKYGENSSEDLVMFVRREDMKVEDSPLNLLGNYIYGIPEHRQTIRGDIIILRYVEEPKGKQWVTLTDKDINRFTQILEGYKLERLGNTV